MQKSQTKNENLSISNSIFLKCTKAREIKLCIKFN